MQSKAARHTRMQCKGLAAQYVLTHNEIVLFVTSLSLIRLALPRKRQNHFPYLEYQLTEYLLSNQTLYFHAHLFLTKLFLLNIK